MQSLLAPVSAITLIVALSQDVCADTGKSASQLGDAEYKQAVQLQVKGQLTKARAMLDKAAEKSNTKALFRLAEMHENGYGGAKVDLETALEYYRKAERLGSAQAEVSLALRSRKGFTGDPSELEQRLEHALESAVSASKSGDPDGLLAQARINLAGIETNRSHSKLLFDHTRAFALCAQAAERGNAAAKICLANFMIRPTEPPPYQYNPDEGMRLLRAAADSGEVDALVLIGILYINGLPSVTDIIEGKSHAKSRGISKSPDLSISWLKRAAEAGSSYAMYVLSEIYRQGLGMPVNQSQAAFWLAQSALLENPEASKAVAAGK